MAPPSTAETFPARAAFHDTIVDVIVGSDTGEPKTFKLHKGVLCFYSGFFDRALNGEFKEAKNGVVKLPEEDVDIFDRFVGWLYTRQIEAEQDEDFETLIMLWVLGDHREVPLLMNACIDAIRDAIAKTWTLPPHPSTMRLLYDNTTPSSALRRFIVHIMAYTSDFDGDNQFDWPMDALKDMLRLKCKQRAGAVELMVQDDVPKMNLCQFHQHEEGVDCAKKKKKLDKT